MKNQETISKIYYTERAFDGLISYYQTRINYWYSQTGELPQKEIDGYVEMFKDDLENTEFVKNIILTALKKGVI